MQNVKRNLFNDLVCKNSMHIRIATYNITHKDMRALSPQLLWSRRKKGVVDLLKRIDADIVCLQEDFFSQLRFILNHVDYGHVSRPQLDNLNSERCAILFRKDTFTLLEQGYFWLGPKPHCKSKYLDASTFRRATWARFKHAHGRLVVCSLHFPVPISDQTRIRIAQRIRKEMMCIARDDPFVVCGDFNTWPQKFLYTALGTTILDTFLLQPKSRQVEFDTRHPWPGHRRTKEEERIDYVFVSKDLKKKFVSYKIHRDLAKDHKNKPYPPSDHCPVSVDFSW
jgi:endonuclease/exonuclease/phosphatase family metal-dependent hydrolase